jgi:hypothetical protein
MDPTTLSPSQVHNITAEGMEFTITETLRASMVEMWLHTIKQRFLNAAPIKCVGLDCEFTGPREGRRHQRATVLQLSMASEVLVFQICQADHVPQLLKDFLKDLMTHKYRGCIVVLSINKSVEPNEEQKVLMSGFDQGFTVNTSKRVFRGIW